VFYLLIVVMKLVIFYLPLLYMILTNHILFFQDEVICALSEGEGKEGCICDIQVIRNIDTRF
jgi:hypothetical protein